MHRIHILDPFLTSQFLTKKRFTYMSSLFLHSQSPVFTHTKPTILSSSINFDVFILMFLYQIGSECKNFPLNALEPWWIVIHHYNSILHHMRCFPIDDITFRCTHLNLPIKPTQRFNAISIKNDIFFAFRIEWIDISFFFHHFHRCQMSYWIWWAG